MKGIEELDLQSIDGSDEHRFQYNGKEKEESFGLNWTDYGWRNYDPQLSRWHGVDNLAEKYQSISPYVYVANNPIIFIDPDGQQIDPASEAAFKQLQTDILAKSSELSNQLNQFVPTGVDEDGNSVYSDSDNAKISELNHRIGALQGAFMDLRSMKKSTEFTFKLNAISKNSTGNTIADFNPTKEDVETNTFTLNYIDGDVGNQVHEVATHGGQIARGDIVASIGEDGQAKITIGNGFTSHQLEVKAYQAQYAYMGKLTGYMASPTGSANEKWNTQLGLTGTEKQINSLFSVNNYSQITIGLIRAMTVNALGDTRIYPSN